jgi:hypothetical protein
MREGDERCLGTLTAAMLSCARCVIRKTAGVVGKRRRHRDRRLSLRQDHMSRKLKSALPGEMLVKEFRPWI